MNPRFHLDLSPAASRIPGPGPDSPASQSLDPLLESAVQPTLASPMATSVGAHAAVEIDGLYLPDGYEPQYAYPLLVWLSTTPVVEAEFLNRMRRISDRNYLGVSLPIDPRLDSADLPERIREVVQRVRRKLHVHSERIVLAGLGEGGTLAVETALRDPGLYGGAIGLGGPIPTGERMLGAFHGMRGFRILLGGCPALNDWRTLRRFERVLWSAGVDVNVWQWPLPGTLPASLWREVDRWLMAGVERQSAVWV